MSQIISPIRPDYPSNRAEYLWIFIVFVWLSYGLDILCGLFILLWSWKTWRSKLDLKTHDILRYDQTNELDSIELIHKRWNSPVQCRCLWQDPKLTRALVSRVIERKSQWNDCVQSPASSRIIDSYEVASVENFSWLSNLLKFDSCLLLEWKMNLKKAHPDCELNFGFSLSSRVPLWLIATSSAPEWGRTLNI